MRERLTDMSDPSIARFLMYLNADPELRERVRVLELALQAAIRQEADAVAEVAAEAGFDVSGWSARPKSDEEHIVKLDCCGFMTSGTWQLEQIL
jgi:hypothetical protein